MKFISKLLAIGLEESMDQVLKRNVGVINLIYLLECSVILLYHPILLWSEEYYVFAYNSLFILNGFFGLYLNHVRVYKGACANYLLVFPLLIIIFCWLFGEQLYAEYYLFFVIPVIWMLLEERTMMILLTSYIAVLFILSQLIYQYYEPRIQVPAWYSYFGYINITITFGALALVISVFRRHSDQYIEKISNKNLLLNKFMSIISHDVRSPLVAIKGTLSLIEKEDLANEQISGLFQQLTGAQDRVLNLLDNLLYWSRQQMDGAYLKREKVDLAEITKECVALYRDNAADKKLTILNRIEEPVLCYVDKEMIRLVIRNMLNNAIKFTSASGKIIINAFSDEIRVRYFVSDTGQGLTLTELYDVRDKSNFSNIGTKGESGVGLGLILCRDFLKKNDGQLYIKSEQGVGSTFSFTLPKYGSQSEQTKTYGRAASRPETASGFIRA